MSFAHFISIPSRMKDRILKHKSSLVDDLKKELELQFKDSEFKEECEYSPFLFSNDREAENMLDQLATKTIKKTDQINVAIIVAHGYVLSLLPLIQADIVIICDKDLRVLRWLETYIKLYGKSRTESEFIENLMSLNQIKKEFLKNHIDAERKVLGKYYYFRDNYREKCKLTLKNNKIHYLPINCFDNVQVTKLSRILNERNAKIIFMNLTNLREWARGLEDEKYIESLSLLTKNNSLNIVYSSNQGARAGQTPEFRPVCQNVSHYIRCSHFDKIIGSLRDMFLYRKRYKGILENLYHSDINIVMSAVTTLIDLFIKHNMLEKDRLINELYKKLIKLKSQYHFENAQLMEGLEAKLHSGKVQRESPLLTLPGALQNHVLSFLWSNKVGKNIFKAAYRDYNIEDKFKGKLIQTTTLVSNIHVLNKLNKRLTERIANNLLFHENIEETFELVRNNQQCLYIEVELKDPHGQRVRNHLVGILSSAGDRNVNEMGLDKKPYGLVERLGSCFNHPNDFKAQRENWEKTCEAATAITMAPYKAAIETLCQEIIDSEEIPDIDYGRVTYKEFDDLLNSSIAQKFRNALKPNPEHVVTGGFLFDIQIFLYFIEIYKRKKGKDGQANTLGGPSSLKSTIFDAIGYPGLQERSQRCDHKIFKKGLGNVFEKRQSPDSGDYSAVFGRSDLAGFGVTHCFNHIGEKSISYGCCGRAFWTADCLSILVSSKKQPIDQLLISHTKRVLHEPKSDLQPISTLSI